MKILKRTEIEAIGNRIYEAYLKLPQIASQHIVCRVDPDIILQDLLGLSIEYRHLSWDGLTYGMTSTGEIGVELCPEDESEDFYMFDGKTVLIEKEIRNNPKMIGKCNFTKCHEASHHIYKMLYPLAYGSKGDREAPKVHFSREPQCHTTYIRDWEEWQADTLASFILLPEELIRQGMFLFDLGDQINYLNKLHFGETYKKFCMLADMLGASKSALAYRMERLGLIKHNQLDNPHKFWDFVLDDPFFRNRKEDCNDK